MCTVSRILVCVLLYPYFVPLSPFFVFHPNNAAVLIVAHGMLLAYHKSLCKEATEKHESKKEHEKALPKQCKITENNFMQSLL